MREKDFEKIVVDRNRERDDKGYLLQLFLSEPVIKI